MKALFVIDMVNGFVKEGAMHDIKIMSIVPCIENLVREFDGDCYFIRDAHDRDAIEFKSFPSHCVKGTSESEVIDELRPYVKKEILKNSTNAFHAIDPHLYDGYDEFVLCGCCTDICVLQFALSLKTYLNQIDSNHKVKVVKAGVATYDAQHHKAEGYHSMALKLMEQSGIELI
ncbi:cysteine hydrolase family protein [Dielma fastidiosa]|uniref:Nicotinamidase-related amidase n=1 Tax=Dielma fastidiosa TaxID=1034346 RepID=A0A318LDC3_9FIRM|nr:isochorismatase family cysteine hydrolase [Dielma fastidiosa]PXX79617.1 nicotinamidase-related amidase [Dielma fastidiosa]